MRDLASAMALLQYGDSFFPSGAISFSWGLEALVSEGRLISFADAWGFISGQLHGRWASFDLPVVIAAHRANSDLGAVASIDEQVEVHTAMAELRSASRRLGEAMLVMHVIESEAALHTQAIVIRRAVAAFDAHDVVVLDMISELAADAAVGAHRVHLLVGDLQVRFLRRRQRTGRTRLRNFAS